MTLTRHDIRLHSKVPLRNNISWLSNNMSLYVVEFLSKIFYCRSEKNHVPLSVRTPLLAALQKQLGAQMCLFFEWVKKMVGRNNEKLSVDYPNLGVGISQVASRKRPVDEAEFLVLLRKQWPSISLIANGFQMRKIKIGDFTNLRDDGTPYPHGNFNSIGVS